MAHLQPDINEIAQCLSDFIGSCRQPAFASYELIKEASESYENALKLKESATKICSEVSQSRRDALTILTFIMYCLKYSNFFCL